MKLNDPITQEQADELLANVLAAGADLQALLKFYEVSDLTEITNRQYPSVVSIVTTKMRTKQA